MTTINQQISFIEELRESFDTNQREQVLTKRTTEQVAALLRDIEENLLAVRLLQLNDKEAVEFCTHCNQPTQGFTYLIENKKCCQRCAQLKFDLSFEIANAKADKL